ncbi:sensor domain-containing diguanylate cyclase [Catellatospora paridis]|uniref:sensor domain-containing diguanylate cyclase n=1 Tax=Catellatospora paridis TaxID=1617086 RepID=UPI0018AF9E66|nr:GGDEF domain-containing protein [Catellatospora paridis]
MTAVTELVDETDEALRACDSVHRACNAVAAAVSAHSAASVDVLLANANHLYLVACSGVWHAPRAARVNYGIAGRVLAEGRTVSLRDASIEYPDLYAERSVGSAISAPVHHDHKPTIGVVTVEFDGVRADHDDWEAALTEIGALLGRRIHQLGGPSKESAPQWLLRHTLNIAAADDPGELATRTCRAAVELSGLRCAALLVRRVNVSAEWSGPPLIVMADYCATGSRHLIDAVSALPPPSLSRLVDAACRHQAAHSRGDLSVLDARGFEPLVDAGVGTVIAASVHMGTERLDFEAAMLVMDEIAFQPPPDTAFVLELLMTNAAVFYERMSRQQKLQTMAESDPLTGLRHRRPLAGRLASSIPSRTAVVAADIDNLKVINDMWGHDAGDRALTEVADAIRQALRGSDEVFRVGGDEFIAVLDVPDHDEAVRVAGRMAAAVADRGHTISVGVALRSPDEPAETTLRRADDAMYAAKRDKSISVTVAS